jgi:putative membrane protein
MMLSTFLKGFLMGICDLVPGISGGTIAFITGIYSRFISSIKNILSFRGISELICVSLRFNLRDINKTYNKYDIYFLFVLFLGILSAILIGSRFILFFLTNYFVFTISFFIGLILASSILIFKEINDHRINHQVFAFIGFFSGLIFLFFNPLKIDISLFHIFISGFVAVSAMFLPGISGSYLLYLLGTYEYLLNSLHNFSIVVIIVFLIGAVLGAIFISRIISFFLKRYHSYTLYTLFGFVIGSLIIPLKEVFSYNLFFLEAVISILLFLIGLLLVLIISYFKG